MDGNLTAILGDIRSEALSSPRLTSMLLGLFAGVALVITAAGLGGLIAYSVSQRTHEIGIRMALGADRGRITAMVLREGRTSVLIGLVIGMAGALARSRLVTGLLFGVGPLRPDLLRRFRARPRARGSGRVPPAGAAGDGGQPDHRAAGGGLASVPRRLLALLAAAPLLVAPGDGTAPAGATPAPAYDASGALLRPKGYRRWVFVGASLGLNYSEGGHEDGPGDFHHVYLRPESYEAFRRTGRFPDKTVLVLELHRAAQKVAPSRHGLFEGPRIAPEAAVKDAGRFPEGWAYFSFGADRLSSDRDKKGG